MSLVRLPRFNERLLWYAAAALMALLYVATVPHGWQCEASDEIEYLGLAHSLSTGAGYTMDGQPYGLYPPLFPVQLGVVSGFAGGVWWWLYAVNALVGFAGLCLLASSIRSTYGTVGRWAAWFALVAYYAWSFSTRYLLAEQLVALLSALALTEFDRGLRAIRLSLRTWILVPLFVLLAAMTKASAAAVLAAVGMAGGLAWLLRRNRPALALAVLAVALGGGFMVGWEVRSQLVTPDAPESYGRWVLKWVGLSTEATSVVAQNTGEGISGDASYAERAGVMANKIGTYVASVARPPDNFLPLSFFIAILCAVGLIRLWWENPASPLGWYLFISVLLGSLTFWASSYHRYLYPLTPILFLACFLGMGWLVRWPALFVPFGLWGLAVSFRVGFSQDVVGVEGFYRLVLGVVASMVYLLLVVVPFFHRRLRLHRGPLLAGLFAVVLLHNAALAADRFRRTLDDETPRQQGLDHVLACAAWIQGNSPPESRVISSLPRMASFLAHRPTVPADAEGEILFLFGLLQGIPPFRPDVESALVQRAAQANLVPAFASGGAAVYLLSP